MMLTAYTPVITNMATAQNFDITLGKFNTAEICNSRNLHRNKSFISININLQFFLA
jgi:hypothetical protein